ncbi:MAG: hypothetical protein J0H29_14920 [Sphingobacteriales bacterium]|nr:hypothetical protein [Sphingobacteriales bacterium]
MQQQGQSGGDFGGVVGDQQPRLSEQPALVLMPAHAVAGADEADDGAAEPGTVNSDTGRAAPRDQDSQGTVLIKNVTLTSIDEASGTISGTIRDEDRAAQLVNVRLAAGVRLVASHVIPTVNNHLPFEWQNLRLLKGKVVSFRIRTSEHGISVVSISERND